MKKRTKSIMASLALAAIAIPGTMAADTVDAFASAELETEQQNVAWYADLDTDARNNVTCREDLVDPVFVPEYDGRVLVKGEITAAGNITCADIQLESDVDINGAMWVEARYGANDWRRVTTTRMSGELVRGIGHDEGVIDHIFGPNDPHVTKPLRVCIQTFDPDPSAPLCKTAKSALAKFAITPTE